MTRGANILQCRSAIRCERALAAWRQIRSDLEAVGLKLKLFGSLARGGFSSHSDIDILVQLGESGLSRSAVERVISKVSGDIPVDLIFVEDLTQSDLETLLGA
ncbi:nucleotidyltransferase domain-containing protein [Sulfitobacter sp. PS-8MA]|uniref:nucleotidyltransferase domain-containing protein n=1 Tax=Sulfitobacter sp. PS-8MA TaxID=3237707 RepID=UPI0034C653D5